MASGNVELNPVDGKDRDAYFTGYAAEAPYSSDKLDDANRAVGEQSFDGACDRRSMWKPDGISYSWGSCASGMWD